MVKIQAFMETGAAPPTPKIGDYGDQDGTYWI